MLNTMKVYNIKFRKKYLLKCLGLPDHCSVLPSQHREMLCLKRLNMTS